MLLSPMVGSPGFGLRFATGIILVVIPCFCLIASDVKEKTCAWAGAWFGCSQADEN